MAAGHVLDEIAQGLRHRGSRVPLEKAQQIGGRPAGVESAPDRGVAEPVDGGSAGGLHVGRHPEPGGEVAAQRARRHRGQVGLQQDVVQRFRQQRGEAADRGVGIAAEELARGRAQRAATDQTEGLRLVQRRRHQVVAQPAAAAGCLPAQPGQDRLGARGRAQRCRGELVESSPAQLRCDGAVQLGSQQRHRAAAVVGAPGQPGGPGCRQPRLDQVGPALGDVLAQPPVVRRGRQPGLVEIPADREESGCRGDLRDEGEPASSRSSAAIARLRSRTPMPPARRALGGSFAQSSSRSSTSRTTVNAAPAAVRST